MHLLTQLDMTEADFDKLSDQDQMNLLIDRRLNIPCFNELRAMVDAIAIRSFMCEFVPEDYDDEVENGEYREFDWYDAIFDDANDYHAETVQYFKEAVLDSLKADLESHLENLENIDA